jgi:hypothetical protein
MDDKEIALITGIVNGTNVLFYHLVNELDASGGGCRSRRARLPWQTARGLHHDAKRSEALA